VRSASRREKNSNHRLYKKTAFIVGKLLIQRAETVEDYLITQLQLELHMLERAQA
jgi:hypothetical protein